jgi:hypothetical protein
MFPVFGGKCLSLKTVHNWVEKFSQGCSKVVDDVRTGTEVAEPTVKRFYAYDFDALVKRWDKYINVGGGYVEKQFFPTFKYRLFYVLYRFVIYFLTLPRITQDQEWHICTAGRSNIFVLRDDEK